tara:strand:- start:3329 stop:4099 length:771 start_codon:yes stop_codon:yes gene_type:complete
MAEENIFKENETSQSQQEESKPVISNEHLTTLVGEGKKYENNESLAKAYSNADNFIEQLKTENQELRSELDKRLNAEDVLSEIKREREETLKANQISRENTTPKLDEEALSKLVSSTLEQRESEKEATANIQRVDNQMKKIYGEEKARDVLDRKAQELNLSVDFLASVAAKSPDAFFNTLGISQKSESTIPNTTVSTTNTEAVKEVNAGSTIAEGTWQSFEALRKSNPRKYFSPEVQNQIFKMRKEKGPEGFYNSN